MFFFFSPISSQPQQPQQPVAPEPVEEKELEAKLLEEMDWHFSDLQRKAQNIFPAPAPSPLAAVTDSLGRVLLVDLNVSEIPLL
jgi:hypothetical protein